MTNVAVVLSGCGVFDGAEINEVVLTLLALEQQGAQYQCFAPDQAQAHVVNHLTGEVEATETRNVLVESARIVRGAVTPLTELDVSQFDALLIPGGFGVAKNLSDFAFSGAAMSISPLLLERAQAFRQAHKPIGLMCIAPTLAAAICGAGVTATIGTDEQTAAALEQMGARHQTCAVGDCVVDRDHQLVTTPAYMLAENLVQAQQGINRLVTELLALV